MSTPSNTTKPTVASLGTVARQQIQGLSADAQQLAVDLAAQAVQVTGQELDEAIGYAAAFAPKFLKYTLQAATGSDKQKATAQRMLRAIKAQAIAEGGRLGLDLYQHQLAAFAAGMNTVLNALAQSAGVLAGAAATAAAGPVAGALAAAAATGAAKAAISGIVGKVLPAATAPAATVASAPKAG